MKFEIEKNGKRLIFNSNLKGLIIGDKEYVAGEDGILIYDQVFVLKADQVILQMSNNSSTLIPAMRVLSLPYNSYFDDRSVVESQNNITF